MKKKTYMQPMTMAYGLAAPTLMVGSQAKSATIGEDKAEGTYTNEITTTDGEDFTMEAKKVNDWGDWND